MRLRACATIAISAALIGCRTPPASPAGCQAERQSRRVILVRQVVADTAVDAASHPFRGAYACLTEPAAYLRAWIAGAEKRVVMKFMPAPPPVCADRFVLDRADLESDAQRIAKRPTTSADVCYYVDGSDAYAALTDVIDSASCRLDVIMYLWGSDTIGWEVAHQLAAKASPSLPVRVLIDGVGNLAQGEPKQARASEINRAVCWLAQQPCVNVIRTRDPCVRLDHRKLVIADGRVAWSGGRNFEDDAFFVNHDLSYTVAGPLVAQIAEEFEQDWERQGGRASPLLPVGPDLAAPNAEARLVCTTPTKRALARLLYDAVRHAKHHVYAENPYFSDNKLIDQLVCARRRGADVRVVLTTHSDSKIFNRANRVTANRLLAAGIRVYMYPRRTHAKALAVDGVWAYTGTGNFDNLSLRHNRELGVAISDGPAIAALEEQLFCPDFQPAWELTEPLPVSPLDFLVELLAGAFT